MEELDRLQRHLWAELEDKITEMYEGWKKEALVELFGKDQRDNAMQIACLSRYELMTWNLSLKMSLVNRTFSAAILRSDCLNVSGAT